MRAQSLSFPSFFLMTRNPASVLNNSSAVGSPLDHTDTNTPQIGLMIRLHRGSSVLQRGPELQNLIVTGL